MKERKIVINNCPGGFGLSVAAQKLIYSRRGIETYVGKTYYGKALYEKKPPEGWEYDPEKDCDFHSKYRLSDLSEIDRDNKDLIHAVEVLGSEADGTYAELLVVGIPPDVKWMICDNSGWEWIAEEHRTWPE